MHVVGVIEIVVGIAVLTRYTRYAAYVVMVWLWCIALNLISQGTFLDIAVRDIEISLAAFTLAALSELRAIVAGRVTLESNSGIARRSAA